MNRKRTRDVYLSKKMFRLRHAFMLLPLLIFSSTLVAAQTGFVFNPRSGQSYDSIQEAINNAAAWDTVLVYPGRYEERLRITRALVLQGVAQDGQSARIVAPPEVAAIEITNPPRDSEVTIDGFDIETSTSLYAILAEVAKVTLS